MDEEWQDVPEFSVGEKDTNILQLIGEEDLTSFTFEGLKRRLGVHPETLSRILYRLEDQGIVEKAMEGYRVTPKAREFLRLKPLSTAKPPMLLLHTLPLPDVPIQEIVSNLRGKWFGTLRWLGSSENDEGITLKWITEDGGIQVEVNFSEAELNIEAKMLWDNDLNIALNASYQLIGNIAKLYSRLGRINQIPRFRTLNLYLIIS